jgi:hypothetical protein
MRGVVFPLLCLAVMGCAAKMQPIGALRPEVLRDVEGYAIASCLASQSDPYLKDQGDAWASVIIQRMKGDVEVLDDVLDRVKHENAKGEMAVIRDETGPGKDKALPMLYCVEIIDESSVRAAIQKAVAVLNSAYEQ